MNFSRSFIIRNLKSSLTIRTIAFLALVFTITSLFTAKPSTAQSGLYVSTFAGVGFSPGSSDGVGPTARFNAPLGIAVDKDDNVIVADFRNHRIRKVAAEGRPGEGRHDEGRRHDGPNRDRSQRG